MRCLVISQGLKKAAPRRFHNEFECVLRNVNEEYAQGQIPPSPLPEITYCRILQGQYGGCQQPVNNQHICDACKNHVHVFVD